MMTLKKQKQDDIFLFFMFEIEPTFYWLVYIQFMTMAMLRQVRQLRKREHLLEEFLYYKEKAEDLAEFFFQCQDKDIPQRHVVSCFFNYNYVSPQQRKECIDSWRKNIKERISRGQKGEDLRRRKWWLQSMIQMDLYVTKREAQPDRKPLDLHVKISPALIQVEQKYNWEERQFLQSMRKVDDIGEFIFERYFDKKIRTPIIQYFHTGVISSQERKECIDSWRKNIKERISRGQKGEDLNKRKKWLQSMIQMDLYATKKETQAIQQANLRIMKYQRFIKAIDLSSQSFRKTVQSQQNSCLSKNDRTGEKVNKTKERKDDIEKKSWWSGFWPFRKQKQNKQSSYGMKQSTLLKDEDEQIQELIISY